MDSRYSETGTSGSSTSDDLLRCVYIERLQRLTDLRSDPGPLSVLRQNSSSTSRRTQPTATA